MTFREKLLSLLIRWLRFATPVESENTFEGEKPKRRKITAFDLGRVGSGKTEKTVTQFKMPTLPKGVIPDGEGLAMDSGGMVGYANSAGVSMNFLGYPVLSELSQRSEYRAPVQTLATEMTRKWIQFKSIGSEDLSEKIKQIEVAFDHFKIRDAFKLATEHDGFFGRGNLFVEIEGNDDRETPLVVDKATIKKGSLKQLKVIEPIWTTPVNYDSIDPTNKYFYKPNMWYVMGKPVHSSRLFTFISHPVADMLKPSYNFSGLSMTQMMMPYVDNWLSTRDSVSDLIHSFSTSGIKTNMDAMLSEGNEGDATDIINRAELFNRMRDNRGLMMLDTSTDEEFFQYNTPLSGLDKLQAQAQEQMAAPCHIPLVKLFGITPSGLNASSEGEIKVYYDYVAAQQQSIYTDPLVTILKIIQLHLFGQIYDDITFEFVPLEQMTEEQIANINKTKAETGATLVEANIISHEEERTRLADDSFSGYNSLDAETLPERREDDPAMDANGEWDESKHPRADNGQFGSGGAGGKQAKGSQVSVNDLFDKAVERRGNAGNEFYSKISSVSEQQAEKIHQATGIDLEDYHNGIDEEHVRHILNEHGDVSKETKRGQVAVTKADFLHLEDYLSQPDKVELGHPDAKTGAVRIVTTKKVDGVVYVIQQVGKKRKRLSVVSMWKKKTT